MRPFLSQVQEDVRSYEILPVKRVLFHIQLWAQEDQNMSAREDSEKDQRILLTCQKICPNA
jgi:hypothetical protein